MANGIVDARNEMDATRPLSKLPWSCERSLSGNTSVVRGPLERGCSEIIARCEKSANAKLIVHAVNCHADLLAALDRLVTLIQSDIDNGTAMACWHYQELEAARAAIARAKGV